MPESFPVEMVTVVGVNVGFGLLVLQFASTSKVVAPNSNFGKCMNIEFIIANLATKSSNRRGVRPQSRGPTFLGVFSSRNFEKISQLHLMRSTSELQFLLIFCLDAAFLILRILCDLSRNE